MIILERVSKVYPHREEPALKGVNLQVGPGEFVYLTGPSGAGKTTLLRLLYGAELPSKGRVVVGGTDLGRLAPRHLPLLRRRLGLVFQDFRLMPRRSVYENVALSLEVAGTDRRIVERRVEEVLEQVKLSGLAKVPADTLSGGEQQRVALARALAPGPDLILADEPTGNLDPENALAMMRLLVGDYVGGATVLVATHDPTLLSLVRGGRVVHLERGRLEEAS
ncbi:MAG: ATP-binding cassette domain-containing protein [Desulfarculus sp.]|nr:ATP-binding cassette domain-containing protein [Pseudomonadota bacterium]MBV1718231.1 ATP-binding cassette domain-containing protein [Desulfarculus sp.]MBU4576624.1 ATP-binding cassette domain-containing protein [Pseudomonadota bacterium]MBU4597790.1 ATP-binding cassette domain-containing protein [Pseudomonadota bacterium]MBV1738003.1 ATP-binding cassette domain-containing protein [Desulfarculus sp.]